MGQQKFLLLKTVIWQVTDNSQEHGVLDRRRCIEVIFYACETAIVLN